VRASLGYKARMGSIDPTPDQLASLLAEDVAPLVMINLVRFRERAAYPPGFDAAPCSGREAYIERYGGAVQPMLARAGGRVLWRGSARLTVIGPSEERWDEAILVEYPSRAAFIAMVTSEEYQKIVTHRTAALDDSRLIATKTETA